MYMKRAIYLLVVLAALCLVPESAQAIDCSGLPTSFGGNPFPTGDFFKNFDNPCYNIPLTVGNGSGKFGDLNALYFQMYFKVDPRYQLIVLGTFPNARYFSISLYDAHSAFAQSIGDSNIVPLTSGFTNPYQPGVSFVGGQKFSVPINLGGTPGTTETGCSMNGYNAAINSLDGTQRHPGMDWNSDAGLFRTYPNFATHVVDTAQHTNPNTAGVVMIRAYLDITQPNYNTSPHIIVRDVASGCAYPAAYALNTLKIVTGSAAVGGPWLDSAQGHAHNFYETQYLPQLCYSAPAPPNQAEWSRQPEYVAGASPDAAYIVSTVPQGLPARLASAGEVLRIRFRTPTTPPTPCTNGCSRSGDEQLRYMSMSFLVGGGTTIASLADTAFTKDVNGDVTIVVGTGATIPSWITPANGYTFLDLTALPNYRQLSLLDMRHISPAGNFNCAGQFVPYRTAAETATYSLMGEYMPVVDYPDAASLPHQAAGLGQHACDIFPAGQPGVRPNCGVLPNPTLAINGVVTECLAPGCSTFVGQPNPPITVTGGGFGAFPDGMPFTGVSNYFRMRNATKNWSAGYTGDTCTVSFSSWAANRIQLVANINEPGKCPLAVGDKLEVSVWNPETLATATFPVTVAAQ